MTLQEQFIKILEKERIDNLMPFLQALGPKDKKEFQTPFKKIAKEYLEDFGIIDSRYQRKASAVQGEMIALTGFVLLNRTEVERKGYGTWLVGDNRLTQILVWYRPLWFNEFINGFATAEYFPYKLNYQWLMVMKEAGYISPSPELIAKVLPNVIFEQSKDHRYWDYKPENLQKYPITLEEHIWYLFQYDTNIHYSDRFIQIKKQQEGQKVTWIDTFKALDKEGKLDRKQLLQEAIGATTKGFNKVLTGWFAELFIKLEPTTAELLPLQDQLLNALNSQQSKPVNTVLNYFKKLAEEPDFKVDEFLDHTSLLFSSETKSVVTATLMVLEKIVKKYPDKQEQVLEAICQTFIHNDEALQVRAAKIIQKYGKAGTAKLATALTPYQENFFSQARTLLQNYLAATNAAEEGEAENSHLAGEPEPVLIPENALPVIHDFDELVFLASQAFDNHESYHLDLLPAALLQFKAETLGENISKLAPAFQRAYSLLVADFTSTMGYLDHLLATFFMNYAIHLINTYPEESSELLKIHDAYMKKDQELHQKWSWRGLRLCELAGWQAFEKDTLYLPYKQLLLLAFEKLKVHNALPLLSTPTHLPGWISPLILINRLQAYQAVGDLPGEMDLQIALARVKLENSVEVIAHAEANLKGEFLNLMEFLFTPEALPKGPFEHESWWMVAALTKSPGTEYAEFSHFSYNKFPRYKFTGQFPWKSFEEHYTVDRYDYATKKTLKVPAVRKVFRVDGVKWADQNKLKSFLSKFLPGKKEGEPLLYAYLVLKSRYLSAEYNDIQRLLLLVPNNPEPLLGHISRKSLTYSTFFEEGDKRIVTKTLEALLPIWGTFGTMAHVFVATCMLSSDKTIRAFAAEIWLKGVSEGTINNELLGEIIGVHESIEFAPLKRLTDLIMSNMYQVSRLHNVALQQVLTAILYQLPDTPIKNLKILLQVYQEVLSLNGTGIKDKTVLHKISAMQKNSNLSKIAGTLSTKTVLA